MADQDCCKDVQLLKRTKISVFVDEALPDILVVTYEFGVKVFKGVLLDSNKRNLPCGITTLNPALNTAKTSPDDDTLYSVNQRFAYTEPHAKGKNVRVPAKYKSNKMTVRLRPRQVLCSKCKGICNENSENVTRKRKSSETALLPPPIKRGANAPITRSVHSVINKKKTTEDSKQSLNNNNNNANNVSSTTKGEVSSSRKPTHSVPLDSDKHNSDTSNDQLEDSTHSVEHSDCNVQNQEPHGRSTKRLLRKKRSAGSVEDLWEENVLEESSKNNNQNAQNNANVEQPLSSTCVNTRTIKISYGPQGEGTVLKIPAQIENLNVSDDSEETVKADEGKLKVENNKAARKALKKAKKEARKRVLYSNTSPSYLGSPRYSIGASSPRYTVGSASPRHGLGGISPRYIANVYDTNSSRRKRHKVKHKKKHRDEKEKKHKEAEVENDTVEDVPKEQIITQKLSINLKRLNNTYTSCASTAENEDSGSEDLSDQVPNFPPLTSSSSALRLNTQTINSAVGADGCRLAIGDVIWGKIYGFPWWPGKILTITSGDVKGSQAHVSWYGSPTSSLIQCDQLSPYLENFKMRYNKKKRGPYKEAIKQASTEARQNAENRPNRDSVVTSPARSIINVVPPALASPREIDVVS